MASPRSQEPGSGTRSSAATSSALNAGVRFIDPMACDIHSIIIPLLRGGTRGSVGLGGAGRVHSQGLSHAGHHEQQTHDSHTMLPTLPPQCSQEGSDLGAGDFMDHPCILKVDHGWRETVLIKRNDAMTGISDAVTGSNGVGVGALSLSVSKHH